MQRHYPDDMASVRVIRELIVKRRQDDSLSSHHLLIVGIDHAEPRENLLEVMEFLRREIPEAEFLYSTQQAYFEAMAAEMSGRLPISSGEQRGPYEEHFFLSNTLSSRVDLKMKNRQLENSLQMYGEPMNALVPVGKDFEDFAVDGFLDQAWRLMVENHSHDAICTCSVDPVLHDIENRMDNAGYWAGDVKEHLLRKMARRVTPLGENHPVLLLWNIALETGCLYQTMVRVPYDLPEHFHLEDADGNIVPAALEVVGKKRIDIETEKMWDEDILRDEIGGPVSLPPEPTDIFTFVRVKLRAKELPPMGYAAYYFLPGEGEALPVSGADGDGKRYGE